MYKFLTFEYVEVSLGYLFIISESFKCLELEWESKLLKRVMQAHCHPFNVSKRWFHTMNPQVHHNLLYHSHPIDIPYLSWYTLWLFIVIFDICDVLRIPCSQCPKIHMSWTTHWTSLLKSVGLPGPTFISPAI